MFLSEYVSKTETSRNGKNKEKKEQIVRPYTKETLNWYNS